METQLWQERRLCCRWFKNIHSQVSTAEAGLLAPQEGEPGVRWARLGPEVMFEGGDEGRAAVS